MTRFSLPPGIRRLFRLPLGDTASVHADIDAELESVLDARIDSLVARGMSPADARAETLRRLGASLETVRDQLHHSAERRERRMHLHEILDDVAHDVRYAARGLIRRPAFTTVAVLTLAIGIGATTAIFSAVNVLLLRSLPFAKPDELMKVSLVTPDKGGPKGPGDMVWSYPKFTLFRDAQHSFAQLSLYSVQQFTITSGDAELVRGEFVGATYFSTLGVEPAMGRQFDRSIDAHPGAAPRVIISSALWLRRFNADPRIVGKTIGIDRQLYSIVAVAPTGFRGLSGEAELFVPITTRAANDLGEAFSHEFYLVARRKPGVSATQAASETKVLGTRVDAAFPSRNAAAGPWGAKAQPLDDARVAPLVKRSVLVLFGAVAFVLLIACVNVANLLLGRASERRREIAVRIALGAGRSRLVRLLLTESALLAALGALASIGVAWIGVHALSSLDPSTTFRAQRFSAVGAVTLASVRLDWTTLAFTCGVALAVGLLFGLVPAVHATRASLAGAMKSGGAAGRHRAPTLRRLLVVAEVALAMVLLAGSGLMIRSLTKLVAIDPGFDARNVLSLRLTVPPGALARDSLPGFYSQLLERLHAVPGVADASLVNCAPLSGGCNGTVIGFSDQPMLDMSQLPSIGVHWATPSWFATLRIPLKRGRVFTPTDRAGAAKVVVINEAAAKKFWPNEDPIGKRVSVYQGGFDTGAEVVGIVGNVRQIADSLPKPDVYLPYYQSPIGRMVVLVRTQGDPTAAIADVRRALHDVAPQYPVYDIKTMSARVSAATASTRFSAMLLGLFAATALSLAVIGIYGVMSLAVSSRTREIGIRIALGAGQSRVRHEVVGEGLALVAVGAAIGVAGALACTRVLQSFLFDLKPSDPATYASIIALVGAAALAASWIPARRAARVDPVVALRAD